MIRIAKKPKVLKAKIELSNLIRKKIKPVFFDKSPIHNYYWRGRYIINSIEYYIYVQHYTGVLRRMKIDYIDIRIGDVALKVKEIHELLETLKAN